MGELIYRPEPNEHACKPFMDTKMYRSRDGAIPLEEVPPLGTIWRCDCGVLWEVVKQPYRNIMGTRMWRKAGWPTILKVWYRLR